MTEASHGLVSFPTCKVLRPGRQENGTMTWVRVESVQCVSARSPASHFCICMLNVATADCTCNCTSKNPLTSKNTPHIHSLNTACYIRHQAQTTACKVSSHVGAITRALSGHLPNFQLRHRHRSLCPATTTSGYKIETSPSAHKLS